MRVNLPLRWFGSLVGLLLVLWAAINLAIDVSLPPYLERVLREDLLREARVARAAFAPLAAGAAPRAAGIQDLAHRLGAETGLRVTVMGADGVVWGESERPADMVAVMENHAGRPEVKEALRGGSGWAMRRSGTLDTEMLYAAVAMPEGSPRAVVRVAMPLTRVESFKARVLAAVAWASAAVALASLPVLWLVARRTTRPLLEMREVAARAARGDFSLRMTARGPPELAGLAADLNHMARELEARLGELTRERAELRAILAGMTDGLLAVDASGRVRHANHVLMDRFRLPEGILGQGALEVFRSVELRDMVAQALAHGAIEQREMEFPGFGEGQFEVSAAALRAVEPGSRGAVVVFHDITRLKKLENLRQEFVANVSHELRTPLAVVRANVETLLEEPPPEPPVARRFLQAVQKNALRLETLIGDLLTLSSVESQQARFQFENLPLGPLVDAALAELAGPLRAKGHSARAEVPGDLPMVRADPARVAQVLANLLDNAVKYTPAQGSIVVRASAAGAEVECQVEDNGPGIAPEHLPRIFERFYRVDKARSRDLGGTGLGLAIVKHLVQAHGGRVWVESRPGQGSAFHFTLPRA
jgi:two-component system phosphate regulon sensor histidine kinase PhoR